MKNLEEDTGEQKMPFVFRITQPFAKMRMRLLGMDRRKRETKIYEYAIHRYYMDVIELIMAFLIILGRIYLAFDIGQPYSGTIPLNESDALVFALTISTFLKNYDLIVDYRKNVIKRIETAAKTR